MEMVDENALPYLSNMHEKPDIDGELMTISEINTSSSIYESLVRKPGGCAPICAHI